MEDAVDSFIVRVENGSEPTNPKNRVKKLLKKTTKIFEKGKDLHRISDAIEEAVGQAKQLGELRLRYEREMPEANVGAIVDPRVMALYTNVTELVGIEDKRDGVINMLTVGDDWSEHPLKTMSIVGFGGLGKTTLAKAVYDKIKVQFNCGAFVSVSQSPDLKKGLKKGLKDILYELDQCEYDGKHDKTRDEKQLLDELIKFLKDKRCIIIIDDVWDEKVWRLSNCAFSKSSVGSRIITTTRIVSVSEACCSSSDGIIYKMEPLSDDISRRLFYKRVFSLENGCPHELEQVSRAILKKCGGIPLAIITIASLLASNRQIKSKEYWYDLLNSFGRGLTENASVEEMKRILLFSYYDLPSHLKPCLLYLSTFPEDYDIMRDRLIWKWIAEGFVQSEKKETSLYELGESYFIELINRSMIQPVVINDEERVEACRVHDMVLDLMFWLSNEENFVTILDSAETKVPTLHNKIRRLSIQKSKLDVATTSMEQVRSLTFFTDVIDDIVPLISSFRVLHVLDLEGSVISDLGCVGKLLHLRYLGLGGTKIDVLQMETGKLQFLQTLDLRASEKTAPIKAENIEELSSSIVCLRHLMCLYFHHGRIRLPSGMNNLTSLEVLCGLDVGRYCPMPVASCNLDAMKEVGHLTKLRVLEFRYGRFRMRSDKVLVDSLSNLHKLQVLNIYGYGQSLDVLQECWVPSPKLHVLSFDIYSCSFLTLPAWINPSSLPLLSKLIIKVVKLRPEDIRLLGMLPALCSLHLSEKGSFAESHYSMEMSVVTADAFPCVIDCNFSRIAAVPSIFPQGAAPRLRYITFGFPAMWISRGDFNLGAGHLPSLEEVNVSLLCNEASDEEVRKVEEAVRAAAEDHPNRPTLCML